MFEKLLGRWLLCLSHLDKDNVSECVCTYAVYFAVKSRTPGGQELQDKSEIDNNELLILDTARCTDKFDFHDLFQRPSELRLEFLVLDPNTIP